MQKEKEPKLTKEEIIKLNYLYDFGETKEEENKKILDKKVR